MEALEQFNPKLYAQIKNDPEAITKLETLFQTHDVEATQRAQEIAQTAEALTAASENATSRPPRVYSLPFVWAWGAPVFNATAKALIAL
jgi:hypothetical protein